MKEVPAGFLDQMIQCYLNSGVETSTMTDESDAKQLPWKAVSIIRILPLSLEQQKSTLRTLCEYAEKKGDKLTMMALSEWQAALEASNPGAAPSLPPSSSGQNSSSALPPASSSDQGFRKGPR
jgi:hypothetical protein